MFLNEFDVKEQVGRILFKIKWTAETLQMSQVRWVTYGKKLYWNILGEKNVDA